MCISVPLKKDLNSFNVITFFFFGTNSHQFYSLED